MRILAEEKKAVLLAGLAQTRAAILAAASVLAPAEQDQVFLGDWSVKHLLAHLTGWDAANLEALQAVRAGRLPAFYAFRGPDWREYNALLVARCWREDFGELAADVRSTHRSLLHLAEEIPPVEFDKDFGVRYRGYKVTIARLLEAEWKDEQEHLRQIAAYWSEKLPKA